MKKVLLIEPDKELAEPFVGWLEGEDIAVKLVDDPNDTQNLLSKDQYDMLIVDIDFPETTGHLLELCKTLKKEGRFKDIPITILTFKREASKIAAAIEYGADSLILKPFETNYLIDRIGALLVQIKLKKKGKKVIDLNLINFIMKLSADFDRKGFFTLMTAILNELIISRIGGIVGASTILMIIKRLNKMVDEDYPFMKHIKFLDGRIILDEVEKASKNVNIETLVTALKVYIYTLLQIMKGLTSDILMESGNVNV